MLPLSASKRCGAESDRDHGQAGDAVEGVEVGVLGDDGDLVRGRGRGDPHVVRVRAPL